MLSYAYTIAEADVIMADRVCDNGNPPPIFPLLFLLLSLFSLHLLYSYILTPAIPSPLAPLVSLPTPNRSPSFVPLCADLTSLLGSAIEPLDGRDPVVAVRSPMPNGCFNTPVDLTFRSLVVSAVGLVFRSEGRCCCVFRWVITSVLIFPIQFWVLTSSDLSFRSLVVKVIIKVWGFLLFFVKVHYNNISYSWCSISPKLCEHWILKALGSLFWCRSEQISPSPSKLVTSSLMVYQIISLFSPYPLYSNYISSGVFLNPIILVNTRFDTKQLYNLVNANFNTKHLAILKGWTFESRNWLTTNLWLNSTIWFKYRFFLCTNHSFQWVSKYVIFVCMILPIFQVRRLYFFHSVASTTHIPTKCYLSLSYSRSKEYFMSYINSSFWMWMISGTKDTSTWIFLLGSLGAPSLASGCFSLVLYILERFGLRYLVVS